MTSKLRCLSPIDGSVVAERDLSDEAAIARILDSARGAQPAWQRTPVPERAAIATRMVDAFTAKRDAVAEEITRQMGRPVAQSPGEVGGFEERARHMISIAAESLADVPIPRKDGFERTIRRQPLGVVLTVAPWNYPYLTAVNSVVPALMAGNTVVLRHSSQTPLCAERIGEAFAEAGLPAGVFQVLHCGHAETERLIASPGVDFVAFTGGVGAGHRIQAAASERFIGVGLELGGKDPGYVRADADIAAAAAGLVDGAFFNSGQSCCGIERIYVDASVHDEFVESAVSIVRGYRLGNPLDSDVTLGPMVSSEAASFVRRQVREAIDAGAGALIDAALFAADMDGTPYLAPQVLVDVDHGMRVMTEESFGPVVGIQRVSGDDEAVALMNDSDFGLTASAWTRDRDAAAALGDRVETGTFFMNRCDYLDPALAWTGIKDSGRGCTLSSLGYDALTRPKSFHLKLKA